MSQRMIIVMVAWLPLAGCVPRVEVSTPEPITINMNVKIDHEIHIKADQDVDELLKKQSELQ